MDEFDLSDWLKEEGSPDPATVEIKAPEKVLTSTEVRVLNYVEQSFWECGITPTPEKVEEDLHITRHTINKAYTNETFRTQLASRGIDPTQLTTVGKLIQESKALSAEQIVVANMMLNTQDKRSEREKLALVGVSSQKYHAWLRQPAFVEFLRKRGEALFQASDFLAYKSLVNNVKSGDNKALEMFFQMRGIWRKSVDVNINIDQVLNQVVEVITRYVKDPIVLQAIAGELESIIDVEEVG